MMGEITLIGLFDLMIHFISFSLPIRDPSYASSNYHRIQQKSHLRASQHDAAGTERMDFLGRRRRRRRRQTKENKSIVVVVAVVSQQNG